MHVIVIGGGVNGLAAAWHCALRGARVTLLEQFTLGHDRGSSHGKCRITRSTYGAETYVEFAARAHADEWPRLERDAGVQLLHPVRGCFFGPAGPGLDAYVAAIAAVGDAVQVLDPAEGRRRFPAFAFPDADRVLDDGTAALVAAEEALGALARQAASAGAVLREQTAVRSIEFGADLLVRCDGEDLTADRVIVAAGPWSARLVPSLAQRLTVVRQNVGYFRLGAEPPSTRLPRFPVWAYLAADSLHYYGTPEFGRPGVKAARHLVAAASDDPDVVGEPDAEALGHLEAWLREQLTVSVDERVGAETCLYTNTPTEDFVIDVLATDPRVVLAAGFSGHGFKFGPLTGRLLAELALDGCTTVPEFEADRARFAAPTASETRL